MNVELEFREALFQRYSRHKKHLITKEVYYKTIEYLKTAVRTPTTKSRHQYEVLQCGNDNKLIKKRQSPEDRPVYYATIEDTFDIISKAHTATGH